jgi:Spy/CpxP family protein refolding chaperone
MKSNHLKLTIATLAVTLIAGVAVSQAGGPGRMHGGMFGDHMLQFYTDTLDLTDAQQAQAKDILAKQKVATEPLFKQMGQTHEAMTQLEQSATFDEAKVRALAAQQSQNMIEMTVAEVRTKSELYQILTPEQKAKLAKMAERHHGGGNPPPPPADDNPNQ